MAVDEINAKGGLLGGRRIEIVKGDDKCDPAIGVDAIRSVIAVHHCDVIIGPECSSVVLAVMDIVEDEKVPMIIYGATNPIITERAGVGGCTYTFRINPHDGLMGPAMAKVAVEELNMKSVSIICLNNDWGRGNVMVWEDLATKLGFEVLSVDYFDYGETNFLPIMTKIKGLNADAIFAVADEQEGHDIMAQYWELGMTQVVIARGGVCEAHFAELFGPEMNEGMYGINFYCTEYEAPGHDEWKTIYRSTFNVEPEMGSTYAYTATMIMAEAIERAGTTDKAAVRDALAETDYTNFLGHFVFDEHNQCYADVYIYRMHEGKEDLMYVVPTESPY